MPEDPSHSPEALESAVARLRAGGLVAMPTETVYGLAADALNPDAVARIFAIKKDPPPRSLTLHVADERMARPLTAEWPERAADLAGRFWPGPLTMVLRPAPTIPPALLGPFGGVALRCPDHPVALALLRAFGGPIVAPAASVAGALPPTTAEEARTLLAMHDVEILDGGPCTRGIESTVLEITAGGKPDRLLRPGPITPADLEGDITLSTSRSEESPSHHSTGPLRSPVRVFNAADWPRVLEDAGGPIVLIAVDDRVPDRLPEPHHVIRLPNRAPSYAARLYSALRKAESANPACIAVERPEGVSQLWEAIRDRLDRLYRPSW